jgi:hypothetical protein
MAVGDFGGDTISMGANGSFEGVVLYAYVAPLTLGVVCLGVCRAAPDVEESALFVPCGRPGGVGDGGGIEDGGRDGDLDTAGGIFEPPEGETAVCEVGALSAVSPGGGVENQLTSVSNADLRFLALLVSTPRKRSKSDKQR